MATKIIDLAVPTNIPLLGSELIEMSEGGAKSVKVAVYEALTRLYYDSTAPVLITDSTGVTVFGDIHCDDLFTSGDTIHVGTGLIKSTAGNVELYYAETKTFETYLGGGVSSGIQIFSADGSKSGALFNNTSTGFHLFGLSDGQPVIISGKNSVGASKTMVVCDPDGSVDLYNAGVKAFETTAVGVKISRTGTSHSGSIYPTSVGGFNVHCNVNLQNTNLYGNDSGGNAVLEISCNPEGSVDLYYDGTLRFQTINGGARIATIGTVNLDITGSGQTAIVDVVSGTGTRTLSLRANGKTLLTGIEDGGVSLYNNELKAAESTNDGFNIYEPANNARYLRIDIEDGFTNLRSIQNSSHFQIDAKNSVGTNTRLFNGDPDAESAMYHAGIKTFETMVMGALVSEYLDAVTGHLRTSGDLSIEGDLFVDGTTWVVHNQEVTTSDNIIVINYGEVGPGVTAGSAGIEVDRGTLTNYQFMFVEASDTFRVGEIGSLQAVATREDAPINNGYAIWNDALKRFDTTLSISGSVIHNDTTGLQGGDSTADEFYHLTQSIHDSLFSASPLIGIGDQSGTKLEVNYGDNEIDIFMTGQGTDQVMHIEAVNPGSGGSEGYLWFGPIGNQLFWTTDQASDQQEFFLDVNGAACFAVSRTGATNKKTKMIGTSQQTYAAINHDDDNFGRSFIVQLYDPADGGTAYIPLAVYDQHIDIDASVTINSADTTALVVVGDINTNNLFAFGSIDVKGHSQIGDTNIDYPGFPTWKVLLNMRETFDSGVTGNGTGLNLHIDSDASDGAAILNGSAITAQLDNITTFGTVQGGYFFANATASGITITDIIGMAAGASSPADNSTITNMIGGKFTVGSGFSMANASIGSMIGAQFRILDTGSGDVNITNAFGILIKSPGFVPSGTVAKSYGLYIQDQSSVGDLNYNLFSAGVGSSNKFEGSVVIDGTLNVDLIDSTALIVSGDIHCNDLFTSGSTIHLGNITLTEDTAGLKVNKLKLQNGAQVDEFSTDTALGSSTTKVPTQSAVKSYVDTQIGLGIETGNYNMSTGDTTADVVFVQQQGSLNYSIAYSIVNTVDNPPLLFVSGVFDKTVDGFKVMFSSPMDTDNYELSWIVTDALLGSSSSSSTSSSSTSSSSSSASSSSSSASSSSTSLADSWTEFTDDTYWSPSLGMSAWSGSAWTTAGSGDGTLTEVGTWVEGYRPTKIRVTHNNGVGIDINCRDASSNNMCNTTLTASGAEVTLTDFGEDIEVIQFVTFMGSSDITKIEFFG